MKRLFYLLMFFSLGGFGQSTSLFEEANEAYADEDYETAIEKYGQILENGETAVAVHYNLGNAYYKLNNIAPSIYHFEKALQLAPNDKDVQNNLGFAQNMTIDAIEEAPETDFSRWKESVLNALETTQWGWAGIILMFLVAVAFIAFYFNRRSLLKRVFFITGILFLILATGAVAIGFTKQKIEKAQQYSIVFAEEVGIKSEPNLKSPEVFTLHEGTKVKVLEDFRGWSKIELPGGNQGWAETEHFKNL